MNNLVNRNAIKGALLGIGLSGSMALSSPMDQTEFSALVVSDYKPTSSLFKEDAYVRIFEQDGSIFLENRLNVGTKNSSAIYKMVRFECYNHSVEATTCGLTLKLLERGGNVHFLGVHPSVSISRTASGIREVEVINDIRLINHRVASIVLQKNNHQ